VLIVLLPLIRAASPILNPGDVRMKKSLLGLSLLALGIAGTAYAAEAMPGGDPLGDKTVTKAEFLAKGAEMFARMDVNHDGKLDLADRAAHEGQMFDRADTNHDGMLSRDEFMAAHQRGPMGEHGRDGAGGPGAKHGGRHRGEHGGMGGMMMRMADTNKDGAVSKDEFLAAYAKHFDMMDTNHDGQLTKAERQAARQKMRAMGGMRHGGKQGGKQGGHAMGAMGDMPPPPPAN
jgi:Ca2+-binding EF-hand superfamily protein